MDAMIEVINKKCEGVYFDSTDSIIVLQCILAIAC